MKQSRATIIVGIGSPHGDDQFGWEVLDQLAGMDLVGVKLLKINTPIDLIVELEMYEDVLLVDASVGLPRSEQFLQLAYRSAVDREFMASLPTCSTHHLGLASALELAESLGNRTDHVTIWVGRGVRFEPLSEMRACTVTAASRCAIAIAQELCDA